MTKTILFTLIAVLFNNLHASNKKAFLIEGKVSSKTQACVSKKTNVFLSSGDQLLFQSLVPHNGSFSFWVPKGEYDLVATTDSSCFAAKRFKLRSDQNKVSLLLTGNFTSYIESFIDPIEIAKLTKSSQRTPASLGARVGGTVSSMPSDYLIPNSYYGDMGGLSGFPMLQGGTQGGVCPTCSIQSQMHGIMMQQQQILMAMQMSNPSQLSYSNFSKPCAWSGNGCAGNAYPSGGPMVMGKPNIYFASTPKNGAKIDIKLPKGSRMIATAPAFQKSWKVKGGANNSIWINKVNYGYIHYDFRNQTAGLQNERGYCTNKQNLVPSLAKILKELKFTKESRTDFVDYFNTKIPDASEYCVYPQLEEQIKSISRLVVSPKPDSMLRINFVIVPNQARSLTENKFSKLPTKPWLTPTFKKHGFSVQEWGMGFLVGQKL